MNLFSSQEPTTYEAIYEGLCQLREEFHRSGRLDDSNAKLDEVAKLFATYVAARLGDAIDFPKTVDHAGGDFVAKLQESFARAARLPYYTRNGGVSIFGNSPSLALRESDTALAVRLTRLVVRAVDDAFLHQELANPYDILNEAFGHFVRDNFRGNIEDAQYLTPAEVVDLMATMALEDLHLSGRLEDVARPVIVADPCCGVGSFLAAFAARYRELKNNQRKPPLRLYGQDKVERMGRLATVNLTLFRVFDHRVTVGNSLYKGSPLDALNGTVDLVLTNPPFGARFPQREVSIMAGDNTPFFSRLGRIRGPVESELLFIDRDLRLLREGGLLLIVVPDSVVSASGVPALLRHHLRSAATLRGVIALPSVTFAQAGTRTKTAVLYVQKGRPKVSGTNHVFMAVSEDLGFQVKSRKGIHIKVNKGKNDLRALLQAYRGMQGNRIGEGAQILAQVPSGVAVPESHIGDAWTATHYQAKRLEVLRDLSAAPGVTNARLEDLVQFVADERRLEHHRSGEAYISVLHVIAEGVIDLGSMNDYAPKTPGVVVKPGEILLSRINPRIPRVLVVPELGRRVLCSTEFEVMRPKGNLDPYMIAFLLLCGHVQAQIQSMASGTSASHNRVKTKDLAQVTLAIPRPGSPSAQRLKRKVARYRRLLATITESIGSVVQLRHTELDWLQASP